MARITVEDCLENVENRFHLVIIAAKRARQLMRGSDDPRVPWDNDKATVVALREIALGYKDFNENREVAVEVAPEPAEVTPPPATQSDSPEVSSESGSTDNL